MALSKINTGGIEDDAITSAKIGTDVIIAEDIAANAVTASELQDSAVTTAKIAPGGVTGVKIAGGAISAPLMGPASVTGPAIGPGAVGTSNIAAGAVTAPTIGPGAVTAPAIGAGAVGTSNIATGAVTAPTIGPGAVTGPAIGPAAVGTSNIAADAVTQPLIGPGAVGSTELGTASVTAPKIGPGAVTNAAIGAGAVTTTELGPAAVTAPIIGPGAVGSTQLATNAVTTVKITDANITAPKIGSGAVTAPAIGTGAVTSPAIGPNAVGAPAIGPGAVGTSQLASDVSISTSGDISMGDNAKVQFGASNDLQIYHDGNHSRIDDTGTGNLYIRGANEIGLIHPTTGEVYAQFNNNGSVNLYYDNSKKLATTSAGVDITGTVTADGISLGDSEVLNLGASNDLQLSHDGNNSLIADTGTGDLFIRGSNNIYLQNAGGTTMLRLASGAGNYLYYNGSSKLQTTSTGVDVNGATSAEGVLNVNAATIETKLVADDVNGVNRLDFSHQLLFREDTTERARFDPNGHFRPGATNTYDLGQSNYVWRNIYTSDFHMTNEGLDKGNDIDGTKGSWTFQEGENDLFLINNKNGKKYKFNLTEIE